MKTKVFKIAKRDLFVGLLALLLCLFTTIITIYAILTGQVELILIIISPLILLFTISGCYIFFVGTFRNFMQVLIIDEEGIKAKNIFSTIYKCDWSKINRIIVVKFNDNKTNIEHNVKSHLDTITIMRIPDTIKKTKYIVFDDGRVDEFHDKILSYYISFSNKQPIKIIYSDKVIEVVKKYKNDIYTEVIYKNEIIKSYNYFQAENILKKLKKNYKWRGYTISKLEDGEYYAYRKNVFGDIIDKVLLNDIDEH